MDHAAALKQLQALIHNARDCDGLDVVHQLLHEMEGIVSKLLSPVPSTNHLPDEQDLGGGDIASLQEQPSTDDDKPLD